MKRLLSHILILITGIALLMSCADDTFIKEGLTDGQVGLKLALNLPGGEPAGTRMGGTNADTDTEPGQGFENLIQTDDIRLLIFSNDIFQEEVTGLRITGSETSSVRFLEGKTANPYEGDVEIVVLANLKSSDVAPLTEKFVGKTVEDVYRLFNYTYGDDEWILSKDKRVPMWGSLDMHLEKGEVNRGNIDLYRAVAKVNLLVNEGQGLDNFSLNSVWVYYANTEGYCAPLPSDATAESAETQFTKTSIPGSSTQRGVPLTYTLEEGANVFKNHIYIPESNNKDPGENKKKLCLVVGGYYKGEGLVEPGKESYYRIDFKDNLESGNNADLRVYDVIRNHSYQFNIRSVKNPGTTTPEEALDHVVVGMDVVITEWVDEPMRGIPDQYTLTTDKSRVTFDQHSSQETVEVWTDYGPSENNWELADTPTADSWFTVEKVGKDHVRITAIENRGVSRQGNFCVQAGNLKKQIIVYQNQPPTANSYVVGDGDHELIVTIKGNGNDGIYAASDKGLGNVKLVEKDQEDAAIAPDKIGIIWETQAGLITLIDKDGKSVSGKGRASYDKGKGIIKYTVNSGSATIGGVRGGNALIGAFAGNGTLLWSWHIWVCPDMVESEGVVKEKYIQNWNINGYYVMDRNLGALDNKPGVASLGLLYQWGRKDPFIGAKVTNDNYSDTGVLPAEIYYGSWSVSNKYGTTTPMTIPETILSPTTLTKAGMSKGSDNRKALLWGTDGGLNTTGVKDLGTKTIYDPCPMGYRIPPVDAFVFETSKVPKTYTTGTEELSDGRNKFNYNIYTPKTWETYNKSSEILNWNENLIYVPHCETSRTWDGELHMSYYSGSYIKHADFYGFYLNYVEIKEPQVTKDFKKDANNRYYFYKPANTTNLTWLPLSGAYDPHNGKKELTFKDVTVEQGSSITVNSFLWTNSSVISGTGSSAQLIPAAMFLHGTEDDSQKKGNGRHIHGLTKSDIKAEPHYAGAVRCVRDVKKDFSESNKVPDNVTLGGSKSSITVGTVYSVNDTWKVVDAGAPWFKITPDRGTADKGRGTEITITALQDNTGSARTATVLIQFSRETSPKAFTVTQNHKW